MGCHHRSSERFLWSTEGRTIKGPEQQTLDSGLAQGSGGEEVGGLRFYCEGRTDGMQIYRKGKRQRWMVVKNCGAEWDSLRREEG